MADQQQTTVSISLPTHLKQWLDTHGNKSKVIQRLIEPFISNKITMDFIRSRIGTINYNEIVALGIEAYSDKIKEEQGHRVFAESMEALRSEQPKRQPLKFVIEDAIGNGTATDWNSLMKAVTEAGHEAFVADTRFNISNRPYYDEKSWLLRQTNGTHTVDFKGGIVEA